MALKPIDIHWIWTGSKPYRKNPVSRGQQYNCTFSYPPKAVYNTMQKNYSQWHTQGFVRGRFSQTPVLLIDQAISFTWHLINFKSTYFIIFLWWFKNIKHTSWHILGFPFYKYNLKDYYFNFVSKRKLPELMSVLTNILLGKI